MVVFPVKKAGLQKLLDKCKLWVSSCKVANLDQSTTEKESRKIYLSRITFKYSLTETAY